MQSNCRFDILLLCFGCLWSVIDCRTSDSLRVTLPNGSKIVGRYLTTHDGKGIRAFMSVPYAEPPIGSLRFKVSSNLFIMSFNLFMSC